MEDSPVVICTSRMTRESGVNLLVKAARHLIARYPDLRLWFIGDGPHRDWIYETMRGDGVRASIAMPGSFCDVDDLFAAADVFLQTDDDGLDFFLPNAISAELPIVALDTESTRTVISGGSVDAAEPHDWLKTIRIRWSSGARERRRNTFAWVYFVCWMTCPAIKPRRPSFVGCWSAHVRRAKQSVPTWR